MKRYIISKQIIDPINNLPRNSGLALDLIRKVHHDFVDVILKDKPSLVTVEPSPYNPCCSIYKISAIVASDQEVFEMRKTLGEIKLSLPREKWHLIDRLNKVINGVE